MKKLVIAEKPSVARDIARVLKCNSKGDGFLYNDEYVVSWAVGHLVGLYDPEDYDEGLKRWRDNTLPIIPQEIKLKPIEQTKKQLNVLKKLINSKSVESLICATDSGREGELIFRYIYELLECKKPFERLWISSMTDAAITDGFNSLRDGHEYDNLFMSARCRSEADWLVGINATRAFTIRYNELLSVGRVQTPTLAIIVNRQKEIDSFVSKDYWEIEARLDGYSGMWFDKANNDESKIFDKQKAQEIADKVKGKNGEVRSVENENKKTPAPLLYDLTELQRDCNKKFGFSAKKTLTVAQDLYEKRKLITYPRTDSRYLSDDMIPKLSQVLERLRGTNEYASYAGYVLSLDKLPITKRIVDNSKISDHHAIIPTNSRLNIQALSEDEFKVFDLVARRFMQVFYPQYVYNVTKIVTECEGESFLTKGNTIVNAGWTELNVSEKAKKEEVVLPKVERGQVVRVLDAVSHQKKTKPPQAYNEATLLSAMENAGRFVEDEALKEQLKESGLGTPATRAAIIERLLQVGYIERNGKSLVPTQKGIKLIEIVPDELKSPETTGKWEKGLSSIAKGKMQNDRFMDSIKRYVCYLVGQAKIKKAGVVFESSKNASEAEIPKGKVFGKCPACGKNILENSKSFYCAGWREGCKVSFWKDSVSMYGVELSGDIVKELTEKGAVKGIDIILPQTREACTADLVITKDNRLEIQGVVHKNI